MNASGKPLRILFLTIFIDMLGFGMIIPILPRYAESFGASAWQIGWLAGVFSLAQFLFAPILGKLSDRFGRKPILVLSILGSVAGFAIMGAATALVFLFIGRIVDGMAGGKFGTAQAYAADISAPERRARAMGVIGAAVGLGFVFGPALGGWISSVYGFSVPMMVAAVLALANAGFVLFALPESRVRGEKRCEPAWQHFFAHVRPRFFLSVAAAYFCAIASFSIVTMLLALFLWHRFDLDERKTGYLLTLIGLITFLVQGGLIGRLVRKFGEARLVSVGALIMAGGMLGLPLSQGFSGLIWTCSALALGNSLLMPSLTGLASRSAEAAWQGRAMGILQSIGSLARWIGPVLGGWMLMFDMERAIEMYARTPFWTGAALALVTFGISWLLPRRTKSEFSRG